MGNPHTEKQREEKDENLKPHGRLSTLKHERNEGNEFGEQAHSSTTSAPARKLELRRDGKAIYDGWQQTDVTEGLSSVKV